MAVRVTVSRGAGFKATSVGCLYIGLYRYCSTGDCMRLGACGDMRNTVQNGHSASPTWCMRDLRRKLRAEERSASQPWSGLCCEASKVEFSPKLPLAELLLCPRGHKLRLIFSKPSLHENFPP